MIADINLGKLFYWLAFFSVFGVWKLVEIALWALSHITII